jgi:4-hydroxy-tetrahydrodipicolinate synthase
MPGKIEGIFTPILVPVDGQGGINEAEYRRFVNWLIEKGVHGLYPNGSTSEFTRFTAEERRRIIQMTCEENRGRLPVLAGAAEANARETIRACEEYARFGVRAVAIVSPYYYKLSPESTYAYFREIALNSPVDVTLYNIPLFSTPLEIPTIKRLSELERIMGIKDSSGDVAFMMRMVAAVRPNRPDFVLMTGWDCVLTQMMVAGADGGTNAGSNVVPELLVKIFNLVKTGQIQEAMKLQFRMLELFDIMLFPFEFPDGFRAGAEMRGFNFGRGRVPQTAAQEQDRAHLKRVLQCVMSDIGFAGLPEEGCAPRGGVVAQDKLGQIVFEVMDELHKRGVI